MKHDSRFWEIVYAQNGKISDLLATVRQLRSEKDKLEKELTQLQKEQSEYQEMAASYGIDAKTMCTLAKSQIKTCADNIRLREENAAYRKIFKCIGAIFDDFRNLDKLAEQLECIAEERASWL